VEFASRTDRAGTEEEVVHQGTGDLHSILPVVIATWRDFGFSEAIIVVKPR
jgi:hypothetical protein